MTILSILYLSHVQLVKTWEMRSLKSIKSPALMKKSAALIRRQSLEDNWLAGYSCRLLTAS